MANQRSAGTIPSKGKPIYDQAYASTSMASLPSRYCSLKFIKSFPTLASKAMPQLRNHDMFRLFFDDRFFDHRWALYQFCHQDLRAPGPFLVSEEQVHCFVLRIKQQFPDFPTQLLATDGAVVDFERYGSARPLRLGLAESAEAFNELEAYAQGDGAPLLLQSSEIAQQTALFEALRRCKMLANSGTVTPEFDTTQLRSLQKYLGLIGQDGAFVRTATMDPQAPPPYVHEMPPILVCVDVEAWESDPSFITEVGICTLDTADIVGISPGPLGVNWRAKFRSRHCRVSEYSHLVNKKYVKGCPNNFQFGQSEMILQADMVRAVEACFHFPFSHPTPGANAASAEPRPCVLMGHSLGSDVKYLQKLGYDVGQAPALKGRIDTTIMYRAFSKSKNIVGLRVLLKECDIDAWFLHNAGNDAHYTLAAAVAMAVGERQGVRFGPEEDREVERGGRGGEGALGG